MKKIFFIIVFYISQLLLGANVYFDYPRSGDVIYFNENGYAKV
jgi:hypothetical protein